MTLTEQGLIGMGFLLLFLGSLLRQVVFLKETKALLLGILIAFCVASLTDSILCYSPIGYLLIVFSALCFGELLEQQIKDNVVVQQQTKLSLQTVS